MEVFTLTCSVSYLKYFVLNNFNINSIVYIDFIGFGIHSVFFVFFETLPYKDYFLFYSAFTLHFQNILV